MMQSPQKLTTPTFILYASQTGNCEQISDDLFQKLKGSKKYANIKRNKLNNFTSLKEKDSLKIVVMVCSSTGNGDMPENGEAYYRFLRRETNKLAEGDTSKVLAHVYYAILGLGSTDYSKYQGVPRFIDNKMKQLGAIPFYYRGEADDATSLELVVEPWLNGITGALEETHGKVNALTQEEIDIQLKTSVEESLQDTEIEKEVVQSINSSLTLKEITHLNPGSSYDDNKSKYKVTMEIDQRIRESNVGIRKEHLQPGQSVALTPSNTNQDVDLCIEAFNWDPEEYLGNNSIREVLQNNVDIRTQKVDPQKLYDQDIYRAKLDEIHEIFGRTKPYTTLIDLANHYKSQPDLSSSLPIESFVIEELPSIKPRFYSLANDPALNNYSTVDFIFSLDHFDKNDDVEVGHCSSWLSTQSNIGSKVKCIFSTLFSILNVKTSDSSPLLLVAQGTGIAPFLSIMQSSPQRPVTVVFGIRDNHVSFICKEEILSFFTQNKDHQLWLACSRDITRTENEPYQCKKGYIQHLIGSEEGLQDIVQKSGQILMCGGRKAMAEVGEQMEKVLGKEVMQRMKEEEKVKVEVWGE